MRKHALVLTQDDGISATPEETPTLEAAGYKKCYNPKCNFHLSPEAQEKVINQGSGYYTCPKQGCYKSYDLLEDTPWHGSQEDGYGAGFESGGGTRIGLTMKEQGDLGEDIVQGLKEIPGYGPITWWHPGGSTSPSPLDGTLKEWGIEVKTIGYDALNHRFVPRSVAEKTAKNEEARRLHLRGILGVLVLLNFRTSLADVYVREMPIDTPWNEHGTLGVGSFRSNTGEHIVAEVPFKNPFMDPRSDVPHDPIANEQWDEHPF